MTRREADVLHLVVDLYANAEIAARLNISKRTVESHISALLRKFAVADRAALIRSGAGLVDQDTDRPQQPRRSAKHQDRQLTDTPAALAATRRRVAAQRQQAARKRAVQRERDSIMLHEAAAHRLRTLAASWEQQASTARDTPNRADALHRAATATQRAQAAQARATRATQRLQAEGVDPRR